MVWAAAVELAAPIVEPILAKSGAAAATESGVVIATDISSTRESGSPLRRTVSVGLTAAAWTRMRRSPGPASGSGSSSSAAPQVPRIPSVPQLLTPMDPFGRPRKSGSIQCL